MHLRLLPPPPPAEAPAIWAPEVASPLDCLEAIEAEELRLLAVGPCGRPLPELADRLQQLRAERAELSPLVRRAPARV